MRNTLGWIAIASLGSFALPFAACTPEARQAPAAKHTQKAHVSGVGGDSELVSAFEEAAEATGVPSSLLAAVGFAETRFRHRSRVESSGARDGHSGESRSGIFGLTDAELYSIDAEATSVREHAIALATLLVHHADGHASGELSSWREALTSWRGAEFSDTVIEHLARGLRGIDANGQQITVTARAGLDSFVTATGSASRQGYADAIWNPAHSSNYSADSRGADRIDYIVIHTIQGSYGSAINWFKNSAADVSAHYVVKSADGEVTQMVDDSDRAWHDACFNSKTIGIEHEGYVTEPELWYTENMYLSSARLAASIARDYNIPIDRSHFFGHGDAPDCSTHTDPGPGWDWEHYMALVRADGEPELDAAFVAHEWPTQMVSGDEAVVWFEFDNLSNMTWGLNETRLGTTEPQDRESSFFVDGNWLSSNRATGADHSDYTPGSTGRFTFLIRAPEVDEPTTFAESFQLVQEGVAWFGQTGTATVTVVPRGWSPPEDDDDSEDGNEDDTTSEDDNGGGCSISQSGGPGPGHCAILLACALLVLRRRHRTRA